MGTWFCHHKQINRVFRLLSFYFLLAWSLQHPRSFFFWHFLSFALRPLAKWLPWLIFSMQRMETFGILLSTGVSLTFVLGLELPAIPVTPPSRSYACLNSPCRGHLLHCPIWRTWRSCKSLSIWMILTPNRDLSDNDLDGFLPYWDFVHLEEMWGKLPNPTCKCLNV